MNAVDIEEVDEGWVRHLEFGSGCMQLPRGDRIRALLTLHQRLGIACFHLLSPKGSGLWFLRDYGNYTSAVRSYLKSRTDLKQEFRRYLRWLGVPVKSENANRCFGLLPQMFGNDFSPSSTNSLIDRRYLALCVPTRSVALMKMYLMSQIQEFSDAAVFAVSESEILWHHEYPPTKNQRLLNAIPWTMDSSELDRTIEELDQLLGTRTEKEELGKRLSAATRFSGAIEIRVPDVGILSPTLQKSMTQFVELCELRMRVVSDLGWPHMVEYALLQTTESPATEQRFGSRLRAIWGQFHAVHIDPLNDAQCPARATF